MYKKIPEIKEYIKITGFDPEKSIPIDVFGRTLMLLFGMRKDTTRKWITWFTENGIITIKGEKVKFK